MPDSTIFPFLELPPELRQMIYMYALTTAFGLWIDVHRYGLGHLLVDRGTSPPPVCTLRAMMLGEKGIISPAILSTCRQIHNEAKCLIWRNQIRLDKFSWQKISLPTLTTESIRDLYIGDGTPALPMAMEGAKPTDPYTVRFEKNAMVFWHFSQITDVTIHLNLVDPGLLGKKEFEYMDLKEVIRKMLPFSIISLASLSFQMGTLRTISVECSKFYPTWLYPYVLAWSSVDEISTRLLHSSSYRAMQRLLDKLSMHLGPPAIRYISPDTLARNYNILKDKDYVVASGLGKVLDDLQKLWTKNGIRVYARRPNKCDRGTMIVFEKIDGN